LKAKNGKKERLNVSELGCKEARVQVAITYKNLGAFAEGRGQTKGEELGVTDGLALALGVTDGVAVAETDADALGLGELDGVDVGEGVGLDGRELCDGSLGGFGGLGGFTGPGGTIGIGIGIGGMIGGMIGVGGLGGEPPFPLGEGEVLGDAGRLGEAAAEGDGRAHPG
jgi:hypothetical protein